MNDFLFYLIIIALICACVICIFVFSMMTESSRGASKFKMLISESAVLVDGHIETLARERIKLIKFDKYGVVDTSKWDTEIQSFIDKILFPDIVAKDNSYSIGKRLLDPIFKNLVEEKARPRAAEIEANLSFSSSMSPEEFERWCAKLVSSDGWKASTTKATGDQGADVIAEKGGIRAVLQCKLYSSPVGNKAVQEALAAQHHYRANASAVVTNATYTSSAIALSVTTGVKLLHYSDLSRLDLVFELEKSDPFEPPFNS